MNANEELMRDRKASYLAHAWREAGGDAETLRQVIVAAELGDPYYPRDREAAPAARATLALILQTASAMRSGGYVWTDASLTTWSGVVAKLQRQGVVSST